MKKIILSLCLILSLISFAEEEFPPAQQILFVARAQLPDHPVEMNGTLKEKAANGFVKNSLKVEMELDWRATPATAVYRIQNEKKKTMQTLDIQWQDAGPEFLYSKNGIQQSDFDLNSEIEGVGITWMDLSFSFLWDPEAKTLRMGKKLGKESYVISVPRSENRFLLIWIEKKTGRMMGAEEYDADGNKKKIIKVVSVKDFDGLWMVKDLDIIKPALGIRTSLRIDRLEAAPEK